MNHFVEEIFDQLLEGVIVVDRTARVLYANSVARQMIGALPGNQLGSDLIKNIIADIAACRVELPIHVPLGQNGQCEEGKIARIMQSPAKGEYVIVVRGGEFSIVTTNLFKEFLRLLDGTFQDKFEYFSVTVEAILSKLASLGYSFPEISGLAERSAQSARQVYDVLRILAELACVEKSDYDGVGQRLYVDDILGAAIQEIRSLSRERNVEVNIRKTNGNRGVLYGNRRWLIRIIVEFIRYLLLRSKEFSSIEIVLEKENSFIHLDVAIAGYLMTDCHREILDNQNGIITDFDHSSLSLLLCKLLAGACGGAISQKQTCIEKQISLQLPVISQQHASKDVVQKQSERIASDLACLLKLKAPY